jgi:hypothetical protein
LGRVRGRRFRGPASLPPGHQVFGLLGAQGNVFAHDAFRALGVTVDDRFRERAMLGMGDLHVPHHLHARSTHRSDPFHAHRDVIEQSGVSRPANQQAVKPITKSLDHSRLAQYLRTNEMKTVVGSIRYRKDGECADSRVVTTQFQGVRDKDFEQFKKPGVQVILHPESKRNGTLKAPFEKARA